MEFDFTVPTPSPEGNNTTNTNITDTNIADTQVENEKVDLEKSQEDAIVVNLENEKSSSSTSSRISGPSHGSDETSSDSSGISLDEQNEPTTDKISTPPAMTEEEIEAHEKKLRREKKANSINFVTYTILSRLPWKIIPFVISVFIIVEALTVAEWTTDIAKGLGKAVGPENNDAKAAASAFLFTSLTSLSCNILNNQPMTILFTRILQDQNFTTADKPLKGAMFGLILGSNFGANLTLVGALAGIMWHEILKQKGYKLGFFQFAAYGFTLMPLVIIISSAILAIELAIFP
jgi:hypothetical protein